MLEVRLLGTLTASLDGRPVDLGSAQRRALVARLAVAEGEVVPVDRLVDDLWAGEPPPRALAGLQAHVSHLRRALEPHRRPRTPATVLVSAAGGYALHAELDAVRARELRRSGSVADLRAALALFSGPPLAEFADAAWSVPEIERLTELRRTIVEGLAAVEPDPAAVVDLLTSHVRDEPLREEPVRLLARALYRGGRQADALAAIGALRRRLADELGLDPSPGLAELETAILRHDLGGGDATSPPPDDAPPSPGEDRPDDGPGLVGRDPELARLRAVADAVAGGPGRLALITGEAGAGKSTLAEHLAGTLVGRGWHGARGRCPEVDGAPPGWAWSEVTADLPGAQHPAPDAGTFHAGRALLTTVAAAAKPLVVVLDDLHRGDEETWRLLRVVASAAEPGVLVVGTFRPDEVPDELRATVAALAAVTAERVELAGLDPDAVAALVAAEHLEIDDEAARRIATRTGGNPLFVREVARLARTVGLDAARSTVPSGVRDVLSRRAAQLPAAALSTLRRAAVLGRDVDVSVLVALEGDDEDRVLAACEAGVVTGLLVESGPDAVRFAHDLVRETLYGELPRLRRARVHAEVLTVLEARRPDDHAALARHALAAGPVAGVDRVLDHAERAAGEARRDRVPRTAAELLTGALELVTDPARRLRLRCALASAHSHAGAGAPAVGERGRALAEAARRDDPAELFAATTCVDGPVTFALAENGELDRPLIDAVGRLLGRELPDDDRARLLAMRAFAWHPREPERAEADADAALRLAPDDDPALRCLVLNARFWSLLRPDRWHELDALGTELLAVAEEAGSWGHRVVGRHARFLHACYREDFAAARVQAATALSEAPDGQLAAVLGWTSVFAALEATLAGRYDEAERLYLGFGAEMTERGLANASVLTFVGLIGVRHAQGRLGDLAPMLAAEYATRGEVVADAYAAALAAAGRLDEAREVWRPDIPVSRDWWWLLWTALRAETAQRLGDTEVAATCRRDLEPWRGHLAGAMSGTATLGRVAPPGEHSLSR
ncbi:BTAD domain-containing putative transcriptional regulator [Actinomycetospora termitidis]|uniref:BTAD domain-containing putative transcriptional regulator n=1 Tax=Actinomycetospora termitidis TaxID=3053470 RepID=A0ABT7MA86_9PSEU|nr:BTAD domain-containing putative transcriptional regulator [Actinomycetospora sp. Odt1-22]MDL5157567.1 BTAD domain-containing putative transcriptional regulator [Actinomycetospora sp. Odt1-22]